MGKICHGEKFLRFKNPTSVAKKFFCFFDFLFCGLKPEKAYSSSCVGMTMNHLGVITHGQMHKPRAYQRQRHKPRTCQSMVNTLQVDGLACITGLKTEINRFRVPLYFATICKLSASASIVAP